ncbi:MAG TPA: tetratricopeptide repeat protein [Bryobacteraceae bacterium]|nr:tetratricopeptide repeat protein [Bryobacteraceae bacterium]
MKQLASGVTLSVFLALAIGFAQAPKSGDGRFDSRVREDFFAGYAGDSARLARGMKTCEEALAANPRDAAALVWHGGGLYFQAGRAFRAGDTAKGLELNGRGLKEMNDGVALAPESLQTRIPRGAILIASARFIDDAMAKPLLETGVADYEKAMEIEKPYFGNAGVHGRGELMGGLADAYRRLGNTDKAREYLQRMAVELPNSPYEKQARRWLADLSAVGKQERFCLGCHTGAR